MIELEVRSKQPHSYPPAAGKLDRRGVGVIERLEGNDFITGVDEGQDRRRQRLGGTGGDQDFCLGVVAQTIGPAAVRGDGLP